jgi:hypothetical protein
MRRLAAALGGRAARGNKGHLFVDAGAGIGAHALYALALGHTVVAVEPFSRNADLLERSVKANEDFGARFTLHRVALADRGTEVEEAVCIATPDEARRFGDGRMTPLFERARPEELRDNTCLGTWDGGGGSGGGAAPQAGGGLAPEVAPRWAEHGMGEDGAQEAGERVRAERLDAVLDAAAVKVHVLKVDVGGAETATVLGAGALLDAHLPCLILLTQYAAASSSSDNGGGGGADEVDSNAMLRVLIARGYKLFRLGAGNAEVATPSATGADDPPLAPGLWEFRLVTLMGACQRCASVAVPEPRCAW